MRAVLTALLWLLTTVALAVALPAAWAEKNLVDVDGYSAFMAGAASDPALQRAVAGELTTQIVDLGYSGNESTIALVASSYTASSSFPGQFAEANRLAHRWMFTDLVSSETDAQGRWVIDLAPMLRDSTFAETLTRFNISVPEQLPVPLTQNTPDSLRPGQLRPVAAWAPWVSGGAAVLTAVFALLMLVSARSKGRGLAALGVSGLLVGAAGWAGLEVGRRRVASELADSSGDIRQIADSLLRHGIDSLHQWLNLALAVGGGLVVLGVILALLGGMRRTVRTPG
jgi:hypothetical protein